MRYFYDNEEYETRDDRDEAIFNDIDEVELQEAMARIMNWSDLWRVLPSDVRMDILDDAFCNIMENRCYEEEDD